ncbi:hypothetical protein PAMC26510_21520 [Caballeronia sordidicola]|uniref:Uncharacterized protein n=1 Tax=Caballeronia sordidicola TaxID=196367 RepID=A0A242MM63_CABSO|nr:hypothetical protein PAMC26510_21520 [Caballeronia sordidicola]
MLIRPIVAGGAVGVLRERDTVPRTFQRAINGRYARSSCAAPPGA